MVHQDAPYTPAAYPPLRTQRITPVPRRFPPSFGHKADICPSRRPFGKRRRLAPRRAGRIRLADQPSRVRLADQGRTPQPRRNQHGPHGGPYTLYSTLTREISLTACFSWRMLYYRFIGLFSAGYTVVRAGRELPSTLRLRRTARQHITPEVSEVPTRQGLASLIRRPVLFCAHFTRLRRRSCASGSHSYHRRPLTRVPGPHRPRLKCGLPYPTGTRPTVRVGYEKRTRMSGAPR